MKSNEHIYTVFVCGYLVIDPQMLEAILSDGYIECLATGDMVRNGETIPECTVVAIPRTMVRSANHAGDWIDVV